MGIDVWKMRDDQLQDDKETSLSESNEIMDAESDDLHVDSQDNVESMDLVQLRNKVAACQACRLSDSRTNTVFGAGSEKADLMFIGEGPGAEEDLQGLPFVGRAGKLLSSMIFALGLEREDVFISNVVKCRPPNNRDPQPQEAKACSQYLKRQIELISPKIIVALGRVSAQLLLDTELPLARLRGTVHKYHDTDVDLIVTYHPAYLLRKPTEKAKSWDDLWQVKQIVSSDGNQLNGEIAQ